MSKKIGIGGDKRRSTAAQFFMEDPDQDGDEIGDSKSTYDKVVELLNHATLLPKDTQKVNSLRQVQELIVNKEPNLLDNFLDEIVAFQHDKSIEVRKFVLGFIEEACKKDNEILPKVVANVNIMLSDEAVAVQKKVIQCSTQLYKVAMKWLCKAKAITEEMESTWIYVNALKSRILTMIDSDNDGIRTHALKFLEMIVIVQTYPEPDSVKKSNEVALDEVPLNTKILKIRKLEEEAKKVFDALVVFHGSAHISSVNLMACMGALTNIGKQRPEFMAKVVQALEALHVNLPPTLAKSQVSSVRKQLKVQLLNLLKHPAGGDFHPQITTLLTDLGTTQQEIIKCLPRLEEVKRRSRQDDGGQPSKRLKLELAEEADDAEDDIDDDKDDDEPAPVEKISKTATNTAIDITAEFLVPRLHSENVSDIVLLSMMMLPDTMPAQFQSSYTPIAAAGTENQIKHLSRLLSTQLTAAGLGPGVEEMAKRVQQELEEKALEDDGGSSPKRTIETVVGRGTFRSSKKEKEKETVQIVPAGSQAPGKHSKRGAIQLKMSEFTKPMSAEQMRLMQEAALKRILSADKASAVGGAASVRVKILAALATQYGDEVSKLLADFIFDDIRNRSDLAFAWLYEEYAFLQGFSQASYFATKPSVDKYDKVLCCLLKGLLSRPENKEKEMLFQRLFIESPVITVNAVDILKQFCHDESRSNVGMGILKELIIKRPPKQKDFLNVLLELSSFEKPEIRNQALGMLKQLHERGEFRQLIEEYALVYLRFLLVSKPPFVLFGENKSREASTAQWTEDVTKLCLYLYLALLPLNHKLIHDLAQVYVSTSANVKRIILRVVEAPVKGMGMSSPELLTLVENCPKGAETLVTRVIHILTDKAPPSSELVARVRDLYHKRVPDVRFLIPVLNGLTKKEVVAALPKLIQLNPVVVKEVFNRLLGGHGETGANYTSPLTPAELLVSLHNIDSSKCDMKTIIKATSLCFSEKHIYTQEVLAVVMQQLMEQNPLPTLLMRTVLQSLSLYPRLIGFVMNILQRLILKQVWKQKKVWEGFIKCCQRTKPGSFQVLLQLPAPQLSDVFETSPDLREPLLNHVNSFTEHQRAFIPKAIMSILTGVEYPPGEDGLETPSDLLIDEDDAKGSESADEPAEPAPPGVN